MRRVLFATVASSVVLAVAPAAALAHSHHHHRGHHRAHRIHARVRDEHFGSRNDENTAANGATSAGTIAAFNNGVLTLRLNDGSTVSGQVTSATEVKCEGAEPQEMEHSEHADGDHGGGSSGGDDNGDDNNTDQGEDEQGEAMCSTANLVPGTMVQDAELTISGAGAIWKEVELAGQAQ